MQVTATAAILVVVGARICVMAVVSSAAGSFFFAVAASCFHVRIAAIWAIKITVVTPATMVMMMPSPATTIAMATIMCACS